MRPLHMLLRMWLGRACMQAGLAWAILSPLGWRWLLGLSALPLLVLLLMFPLIPEVQSPCWCCC